VISQDQLVGWDGRVCRGQDPGGKAVTQRNLHTRTRAMGSGTSSKYVGKALLVYKVIINTISTIPLRREEARRPGNPLKQGRNRPLGKVPPFFPAPWPLHPTWMAETRPDSLRHCFCLFLSPPQGTVRAACRQQRGNHPWWVNT
jgi:hypothetical protein